MGHALADTITYFIKFRLLSGKFWCLVFTIYWANYAVFSYNHPNGYDAAGLAIVVGSLCVAVFAHVYGQRDEPR